ncbi:hypothetical protein SS1G_08714 [Sclerotinia sclerotiorum 1980 UF-70]|nr:hypothetical protein SS1G_08714 [Sclerotinia sclerotiorum 1980 UF-70]EDN92849.1 hypothetical protein SS1G_08714 [Sclerotinia sclerotiorum 1980 UF-70]
MIDIAFGGDGATKPLPLISGHSTHNLGTQEIRLIYETIPQQIDQSKPLWIYQYRNSCEKEWNSFYAFSEHEFLDVDWEMVNFYVSGYMGEGNFQTRNVLVVGFLRGRDEGEGGGEGDREGGEEVIIGKRMLVNGVLKENLGGKTRVVRVCENEEERVRVLREVFGIVLLDEEIAGIRGRCVELRGERDGDGSGVVGERKK